VVGIKQVSFVFKDAFNVILHKASMKPTCKKVKFYIERENQEQP